jgi:predicted glutamine amidotransferase
MCVIGYYKSLCSEKILQECEEANPHGGGYAFWDSDNNVWRSGKGKHVSGKLVYARMKAYFRTNKEKGKFLFHFRIATHGNVNNNLCHPFPFGDALLFHNGIVSNANNMLANMVIAQGPLEGMDFLEQSFSDSQVLAFIAKKIGHQFLYLLPSENRFAICLPDGEVKLIGDFETYEEGLFSNTYFKYDYTETYKNWDKKYKNYTRPTNSIDDTPNWKNYHLPTTIPNEDWKLTNRVPSIFETKNTINLDEIKK